MSDAAGGLLPNFIRGTEIVGLPVRGVAVLIGIKIFVRIGGDNFLHAANRAVGAFIAGSSYHFRAEGGQDALALVRGAVWQAERNRVAHRGTDHGVGNSSVAAGCVNDGFPGAQGAAVETGLNHAEGGAILY